VLGEPVGASILALLILREVPRSTEIIGGIFILSGLYIVLSYGGGGRDRERAGGSFG
jgi:drug/metabolite transporter (DMT)-like permease